MQTALLLTAVVVWLANSIHSTPDLGPSSRDLLRATLPHIERRGADPNILPFGTPRDDGDVDSESDDSSDDEDDDDEDGDDEDEDQEDQDEEVQARRRQLRRRIARVAGRRSSETVPAMPYGILFLREIRVGRRYPIPRLRNLNMFISDKSFKYLFRTSLNEIRHDFFKLSVVLPVDPYRTRNKTKRTPTYYNFDHDYNQGPEPPIFNIQTHVTLDPPQRDNGSDLDSEVEFVDEDFEQDVSMALSTLWRQFLVDIAMKSPNKTGSSSYLNISDDEKLRARDALYQNRNLGQLFTVCYYKLDQHGGWNSIFDHFFPKRGYSRKRRVQNYPSCRYWLSWLEDYLNNSNIPTTTINLMRKHLKKKFNRLYWLPYAQSDRIWSVKVQKSRDFLRSPRLQAGASAPWILINWRVHHERPSFN